MKNYFSFNLNGKKLLPIWLLFLILIIVPYISLILTLKQSQVGEKPNLMFIPFIFLLIIGAFLIIFYLIKLIIENIGLQDKCFVFSGKFGKYVGIFSLGFFLSIMTLGIYSAWFIRDIHNFFIDNTSYDGHPLKFKGSGKNLFLILLVAMFLPIIILSVALASILISNGGQTTPIIMVVQQIFTSLIMIPYTYLIYKWIMNIDYKGYNIHWETNFWNACGKLALEIFLTMITLGIYFPLAALKLYEYFSSKTVAVKESNKIIFGFDIDSKNDFLFIWGKILLTIITLGVYYPWAMCDIYQRILGKTYISKL